MSVMDKIAVLQRLEAHEDELRGLGLAQLYLFGSVARGEEKAASDVDLFFEDAPGRLLSYFGIGAARARLRDILQGEVDLVARSALRPTLRDRIEREAVRVF
jgi:predicted nucleotidyltransferase